ncbi:autotransporter outer membrane beta-barrel domain-containing protein [Dokdonia sp. R86516]|uniref:autotransporter outer membrane beta-barrel domain-containing protein n=1 Tax=Dokdonia sp. R86516 TaxID=3093856 RepID=UPI0037CC9F39
MKKLLLLLPILILSIKSYSQNYFEKGYYIDNNNEKTICLIKNIDWKNNPINFEFKLSQEGEVQKRALEQTKEFGIDNTSKYIRSIVNIDRSSETIRNLTFNRNPVFNEEVLFLKVLLEGNSTLFKYVDGNIKRFFYKTESSNIRQLVFKKYKSTENNIIENNTFRQQLYNELKCQTLNMTNIERVNYTENDLVNYFEKYNKCGNQDFVSYGSKIKRDGFNLSIRPRLNSSGLTIQNSIFNTRDTDFDNEIGFGFGIEAEFVLPYNNNKWSIIVEPTYQSYKSELTSNSDNVSGGELTATADYSSIEIPIGLRHYFFLNENSKIFLNASYVLDLSSNSSIDFTRSDGSSLSSLDVNTTGNLALGIGFKQNDKYSLEIRYNTNRELLGEYESWSSEYKTLSLIFGYSIF